MVKKCHFSGFCHKLYPARHLWAIFFFSYEKSSDDFHSLFLLSHYKVRDLAGYFQRSASHTVL